MKKYLALFALISLLGACSDNAPEKTQEAQETEATLVEVPQNNYENIVFNFDKDNLPEKCDKDSMLVCAIENTVKCVIKPDMSDCDANKMPSFIFMEDENIIRPTHFDYKITKIKPLTGDMAEVYTSSNCNGTWFGLCGGDIVFVTSLKDDAWVVKELYAIEKPQAEAEIKTEAETQNAQ